MCALYVCCSAYGVCVPRLVRVRVWRGCQAAVEQLGPSRDWEVSAVSQSASQDSEDSRTFEEVSRLDALGVRRLAFFGSSPSSLWRGLVSSLAWT